jgi:hypothetical protein
MRIINFHNEEIERRGEQIIAVIIIYDKKFDGGNCSVFLP